MPSGQTIRVNDRDLAVVGVAPQGFQGTTLGLDFSLWVPATMAPALLAGSPELETRSVRGYQVMGRLQPGVEEAQAQAELDARCAIWDGCFRRRTRPWAAR